MPDVDDDMAGFHLAQQLAPDQLAGGVGVPTHRGKPGNAP